VSFKDRRCPSRTPAMGLWAAEFHSPPRWHLTLQHSVLCVL